MTTTTPRNSFVLYTDNHDIFCSLSKDQKADLIDAIFIYQKTGELPTDPIIKVGISSFISQFKRDSQKWEKTCQEKTTAGKMGNLKRWHPQLYKKVIDGKISLDDAMLGLQPQESSQPDPTQSDPIGEVANIAVNDSVSVSVNDIILTISEKFDLFWNLYNKKTSKADAERKFAQSLKKDTFENIMSGLQKYVSSRGEDRKYWKDPSTWLNKGCWNDEYLDSSGNPVTPKDSFCQSLNQSLGQDLVKSLIEGEIITIKLTGASANDKWDALSQDLKDSALAKVKAKFGKETKISF